MPLFFFFFMYTSSHASLLSVRRSHSAQVIIHHTGDSRRVCSWSVCVYTLTDLDQARDVSDLSRGGLHLLWLWITATDLR